jgi:hypothetical protein
MWRRHVTSNSNAIATTKLSNFLALSGKIDTSQATDLFQLSENCTAHRYFAVANEAMSRNGLLYTLTMWWDWNRNDLSEKAPTSFEIGAFNLNPAASYSSIRRPYSTIGAGGLNGRVRDGIGCDTSAIATGNRSS